MGIPSVCRGCGASKTVKAHLVPSAFVHDLRGSQKYILIGWALRIGRMVSQSGLIDRNILCGVCDNHLGKCDRFGIEFCRTFGVQSQSPARDIFRIRPADTENVVKFFVSILWRYSISSLQEAKDVNLGSFEDTFKDILFAGASCASEPATTLWRYRSRVINEDKICLPPFKSPFVDGHLEAYSISVGGFRAFVKVDPRPVPTALLPMIINGKSEITGGYLDFENTPEFTAMRAIVENMQQKSAKRTGR
jgi:hypothetical protein